MLKSWMDLGFQLTPAEKHTVLWDRRIIIIIVIIIIIIIIIIRKDKFILS